MRLRLRLAKAGNPVGLKLAFSTHKADSNFDAESLTRVLRWKKSIYAYQVDMLSIIERFKDGQELPVSFKRLGIKTTDDLKTILNTEYDHTERIAKICETFIKELQS